MRILVSIELYVRVMIMMRFRKFVFPTWVGLLTPTYYSYINFQDQVRDRFQPNSHESAREVDTY